MSNDTPEPTSTQTDPGEAKHSTSTAWFIAIAGTMIAAGPHAVFPPPLELHMAGDMQGWLGISVWAPAILAGIAFFFGVEFGARIDRDRIAPSTAAAATIGIILAQIVYFAMLFEQGWTDMGPLTPWGELERALPLYAALGALQTLFWQGYVQHRAATHLATGPRVAAVAALNTAIYLPFFLTAPDAAPMLLAALGVEAVLAATVFELGVPVWATAIVRAIGAAGFIWFQQATLL